VQVNRYTSAAAAHDAFASRTASAQPTQVSGFDEAAVNAGTARLRHGSDVVSVGLYVNPILPPTAVTKLAAAVAQHYSAPAATQKAAVAGPGDLDPCGMSTKGLKAVFHVGVTSDPAVSDAGTLGCRYTFAGHGSVLVTTTTAAALAKLQPPMTLQQWYARQRAALVSSGTVDVTGLPGQAAISIDTSAVASVPNSGDLLIKKEESKYLRLRQRSERLKGDFESYVKDLEKETGKKIDPQQLKPFEDALERLKDEPHLNKKDYDDAHALVLMMLAMMTTSRL
jgi:hypothetical protein